VGVECASLVTLLSIFRLEWGFIGILFWDCMGRLTVIRHQADDDILHHKQSLEIL